MGKAICPHCCMPYNEGAAVCYNCQRYINVGAWFRMNWVGLLFIACMWGIIGGCVWISFGG